MKKIMGPLYFKHFFAAAVALSLLVAGLATAQTAVAAGKLSTSLGVGCRVANGSATLSFKPGAKSTGDVWINGVVLKVNGSTMHDSGPISLQNYSATVDVPAANGSYSVLLVVDTDDLPDATRTATATVSGTRCSVRTG